jgi:hypothetical protein
MTRLGTCVMYFIVDLHNQDEVSDGLVFLL